jgi:hypothetical protein
VTTFDPEITSGTAAFAYNERNGRVTKVGNTVTVEFFVVINNLKAEMVNATTPMYLTTPYSVPYDVYKQFPQVIRAWGNVGWPDTHKILFILPCGELQYGANGGASLGALYKESMPAAMEWLAIHGLYTFIDD